MARPTLAAAMVVMMVCASFIAIFGTTTSEASYATYSVGDKFALKGEKDLSLSYSSINQMISIGDDDEWVHNAIIEDAWLDGYVTSAAVFEVIGASADEYVMKITAAQNFSLAAKFTMTGEMVDTGSYIEYWSWGSQNPNGLLNLSDAPVSVKTFSIDGKIAAGSNQTFIVHLQKSDLAVKSVQMNAKAYARGYIDVMNYPVKNYYYDGDNNLDIENITAYETFRSNITLDLSLNGEMSFDPYLAIVKDAPVEKGEWEQESYLNATFDWTGVLNVTGMPERFTDEWFNDETAEWGITGFPIDLAKIYNPYNDDPRIDNGTLEIEAAKASMTFCNVRNVTVDDPVHGNISAYRLGFEDATNNNFFQLIYCPANGYLVGAELTYPLPMAKMVLDMKSVPVSEAEVTAATIAEQVVGEKTYEELSLTAGPAKGFLDDPMNLLLIVALVAIAAIAAVGVVFMVKRKSRPKA